MTRARVSLVRCGGYEPREVEASVRSAVSHLGTIQAFVKPGDRVLIKPNLLSARLPEEGVDTHPEVVRAVARLAKEARGIVSIGDSPGGYEKDIDLVFARSGMRAVAEEEGVALVRFNSSRSVNGHPIARAFLDADVVVSVPKFKTHGIATITAGVKNMFGCVTGLAKAGCHLKAPREKEFAPILAAVYAAARPHLTILDAIVSMEGDGPAGGTLRKTGFVAASPDAVALDAVLASLIGLEPHDVATTKVCAEQGLGEAKLERIEILGSDLSSFVIPDFKLPQTKILRMLPRSLVDAVASLIKFKPVIDGLGCRRCNLCKLSCPVDAITIAPGRCAIDYHKCVRCLCCHEVCPYGAIYIKRNILARMVLG